MVDRTSKELVNFYGDNLMSGFREIELRKKVTRGTNYFIQIVYKSR